MKCFEGLRRKGVKKIQRVIIRQGNERAGAHTRLSYNQTDIEVYSALNTAFQSGELKMEACESSHWVKTETGLACSRRPEGRKEGRKEARPLPLELRRRRRQQALSVQAGTHTLPAAVLQIGLRPQDLAGLLDTAKPET